MSIDQSRLDQLEASQDIIEFAAGAGLKSLRPAQTFLAPVLPVRSQVGRYKVWGKDARLVLPNTIRQLGGDAVQIAVNMNNANFECVIHAADIPLSGLFADNLNEYLITDSIALLADIRGQVAESETINTAFLTAGAGGAAVQFSSNQIDPVKRIDAQILALMKTAKTGEIAVLFDPIAWDLFKNNQRVIDRSRGNLSWDTNPALFHGNARYQATYSVMDANPMGLVENIVFQMPANTVLIFARSNETSRLDPSFLKTFLFTPNLPKLVPGAAPQELTAQPKFFRVVPTVDNRGIIVRLDFSHQINVTNTQGVYRMNVA